MSQYRVIKNIRSTHKNHAPPFLDEKWQRELNKLGGFNMYGEPNLKWVWGQSEQKWYAGRWRMKYLAPEIAPVKTITYKRVKTICYDADNNPITEDKFYASEAEANQDTEFGGLIRPVYSWEHIGRPVWILEQWHPAEEYGSEEFWQKFRYKDWYSLDTGFIPNCDRLGEYPYRGRYERVFDVGIPTGEYTRAGRPLLEYQPINEDVIEAVKARLQEREKAPKEQSVKFVGEKLYKDDEERELREEEEDLAPKLEIGRHAYAVASGDKIFPKL